MKTAELCERHPSVLVLGMNIDIAPGTPSLSLEFNLQLLAVKRHNRRHLF